MESINQSLNIESKNIVSSLIIRDAKLIGKLWNWKQKYVSFSWRVLIIGNDFQDYT